MTLLTHRAQLEINRLERRTLDGREYAVAPMVAIVAGVVNGMLAPADEIGAYVEAWNGRPVPVRHPSAAGEFISANHPSVIEQAVIGQIFNAHMDEDRLKGEMWFDVAKAQALGGDALAVLERLDGGLPVEISTAYFCDVEPTPGVYKGKKYNGIQRNLRPDHIAVLPDEAGACSWQDGCGAPRVNSERGVMEPCGCELTTNQNQDGVMVAFFLSEADAAKYALSAEGLPEGSEALPAPELHVTLAYLGTVDEVSMITDEGTLLGMVADWARYQVLISGQISGIGRFNAGEGEPEPIYLSVDAPSLVDFRCRLVEWIGWQVPISRLHGFYPHITLAYVPAAQSIPLAPPAAQSIAFDSLALAWGGRVTMFRLQGEQRMLGAADVSVNEEQSMEKQELEKVRIEPGKEAPATNGEQPRATDLPAGVLELAGLVTELGGAGAVREAIQSIQVNARRMREDLVSRLAANRQCAFTQEQLAAMPLEHLEALERSLRPADYSGRSGMATNAFTDQSDWEDYQAPAAK